MKIFLIMIMICGLFDVGIILWKGKVHYERGYTDVYQSRIYYEHGKG